MPMLHLRLTEPEMADLKAAAKAAGVNLSAHVRTLLSGVDSFALTRAPFVHPRLGVAALREREGSIDRQGRFHDHDDPEMTGRPGCAACVERLGGPQVTSDLSTRGIARQRRRMTVGIGSRTPTNEAPTSPAPPPPQAPPVGAAERAHRTHAILERAAHTKPRPPR